MHHRFGLAVLAVSCLPLAARATEFDNTHVDLGYVDTLGGMTPDPGLFFRDDVNIVVSGRLNDGAGHRARLNLTALGGGNLPLHFHSTAEADIVSVSYVPEWKVPFLNATVGTAVYGTAANSRASLTSALGLPETHGNDKAGIGDITVVPMFFAICFPSIDVNLILAPLDFTAPIGRYSKTDPIGNNLGLNYFSYRPALVLTYLNKGGQDFSINLNGSMNSQNQATAYKSGNEVSFTYAFEQYLTQKIAIGVGGYFYKQITNDTRHGTVVNSNPALDLLNAGLGNKGETFAFGPIFSYHVSDNAMIQAHWDHEPVSYDRPQRDQIFVRGILHF